MSKYQDYPFKVVRKPSGKGISNRMGLPSGDFTSFRGSSQRQIPKHYPVESMEGDWIDRDYGSAEMEILMIVGGLAAVIGIAVYLIKNNVPTTAASLEQVNIL